MPEKHIGKVVQVMGPVLDIRFRDGELPALLNAVELENNGKKLIVEVAQHIGDNVVRCIAMAATDGLVRGTDAVDTGEPIKVPVGDECLGRVFNLLGEPVDEQPAPENIERWPIHRPAPAFDEQESATEILETGIKVVDLICPYAKGGKIGLFGGAGAVSYTHLDVYKRQGWTCLLLMTRKSLPASRRLRRRSARIPMCCSSPVSAVLIWAHALWSRPSRACTTMRLTTA